MNSENSSTSGADSKRRNELTLSAIILGIVLSVIMGAANVYLGLRVGMTVSASIPAAVVAMGVFRTLRRRSLLESNLVQTAASAGESLAAGIIFTMPAMILAGVWTEFNFWTTTLVALTGGMLGVLLMIPMRRVFVVDNRELQYPEGVACAEVLRTGSADAGDADDQQGTGVRLVVWGTIIGAGFKLAESLMGILRRQVEWAVAKAGGVFYVGADVSPALIAVGYIVGLSIAVQIFLGGAIGWLVVVPLLSFSYEGGEPPAEVAWKLWTTQIRYMGVGTMLVGGVASIWRVRPGLMAAVREIVSMASWGKNEKNLGIPEKDIGGRSIVILTVFCIVLIAGLYFVLLEHALGLTLLTIVSMLVMSFFFAAVASYIVGLVGNSNSPVSGMTITAVLATGGLIYLFGFTGTAAIVATLGVAGIVCCVACTSGDVCNDLKTGFLVGASPRNQQVMQIIGVLVAAFVMAPVLTVLHEGSLKRGTGGIGGEELAAPQAALFASLVDGFFGNGELPRNMIFWGIGIGILLLAADQILHTVGCRFRLYVMPVAVGIYLPFELSMPIFLGGVTRFFVDWQRGRSDAKGDSGVLLTSGIIAGESLIGVVMGLYFYTASSQFGKWMKHNLFELKEYSWGNFILAAWGIPTEQHETILQIVSLFSMFSVGAIIYFVSLRSRKGNE